MWFDQRSYGRLTVALAVLALGGAGCGGGGKPGYCSDLSDLQQSIKDIGGIELGAGAGSELQKALKEVEANARSTVASAKSDFPDETAALDKSVSGLKTSAGQLADSPTPENAARVAADVSSVVSSVNGFADATKSKCD